MLLEHTKSLNIILQQMRKDGYHREANALAPIIDTIEANTIHTLISKVQQGIIENRKNILTLFKTNI